MQIATRYAQVRESLTERARRLFVASEAMAFGYGGIAAASRATGMAASVIGRGSPRCARSRAAPRRPAAHPQSSAGRRAEEDDGERPDAARRFAGAGRVDDARRSGVAAVVDRAQPAPPRGRADAARASHEHEDGGAAAQATRLQPAGQSQAPRGRAASGSERAVRAHQRDDPASSSAPHEPAISVDTKKKELVGPYKNGGRELRAHGRSRGRARA